MRSALAAFRKHQELCLGALALGSLYVASLHSYLLFHSLTELFSVVVASTIFIIAWNARRLYDNAYLLVIGTAFLFVGGVDLIHTLAYRGMGVFAGYDANLPTQLWIAGRALEAGSLLIGPLFLGKRPKASMVFLTYAAVTAALLASIFVWHVFPVCYVEGAGRGLTPFKIVGEYVISSALVVALVLLWSKRSAFDSSVLRYLAAAVVLTIASEVAFTQYIGVYDTASLVGHLLKIAAFYFVYKAIVQTALTRPYNLLFRELKQREEQLQASQELQDQLAHFIVHDLRSPLTSVLAGIEALRGAEGNRLSETHKQLVDAAIASSSWVLTLADALLDSSRLESGKMPLHVTEVNVKELISSSLVHVSAWAQLCHVDLRVEVDGDGLAVAADRQVTTRVLINLLSNAIKHSPRDSVVTIRVVPAEGGMLAFSVSDQGPGIPREWAHKVFERFGMVEARRAGAAGTGLGLSFCRLAVEAQGGHIRLAGGEGQGTTIVFTLPTTKKPAA